VAYALGALFFLLVIPFSKISPVLAFSSLCLASFVKDFAMGASWATTIDIGHRYSGTVAGFMNMIGNLGTVFAAPVAASIALAYSLDGGKTRNWSAMIPFYAAMFGIAAVCWLFIEPRRVIVYSPTDQERLKAEGIL
jgi:ACS family glucarate transporter-like MFS transporter